MKRWSCGGSRVLCVALAVGLSAAPARAIFMRVDEPVPVARLVRNLETYIQKHPKEARGYYVLGRIHSLAYAQGQAQVDVITRDYRNPQDRKPLPLPEFPGYQSIQVTPANGARVTAEQRRHFVESVRNYARAVKLAPKEALYWLGYGWMLEQGSRHAAQVNAPFIPRTGKAPARAWQDQALAAYRRAYQIQLPADLKLGHLGPQSDPAISLEAAEGIQRLLKGRKLTPALQTELGKVNASIHAFSQMPRAITPIIFPVDGPAPLADLLAEGRNVTFDLGGDGRAEQWPWVGPRTGILVWDPKHTGRVESGRQLFGTATWSMIWRNGYEPLAALDDDRDGWLAGRELAGIAVWRDGNGNAQSEPGEVTPVREYGITRIAARPAGKVSGVPANSQGLQRTDGSWLPTYDWTPTSLPSAKPALRNAEGVR